MRKIKRIILLLLLSILSLPFMTSCSNDKPEQGDVGPTGNGISMITKTSTDGLVDTYTIIFTDGSVTTFTITNGSNGISGNDGIDGLSSYEIYCKYHSAYKGSEEEWINALAEGSLSESYNKTYNVIFTLATIPPVLSALDAISNEYVTAQDILKTIEDETGLNYYDYANEIAKKVKVWKNVEFNKRRRKMVCWP